MRKRYRKFYDRVPTNLKSDHLLDVNCWLWRKQRQRVAEGRDLKVIITSRDGQTGTGKTTLSLWLAMHFDRHGFDAEKITLHPEEFHDLYNELPVGSCMLMDEGEQLDNRRSMSNKNVDFWNLWQMNRFRQITSILTLPTRSVLDKRGMELADIWINVIQRGLAKVHDIRVGDYDKAVSSIPVQEIKFPDVSYLQLKSDADDLKQELVEGANYDKDEEEIIDPDKIRRDQRDEDIINLWENTDLEQDKIGQCCGGITQTAVSKIVNESA
jgi:hypothetical protein